MSRFKSSLYRPYGAYELKATYQRHLLFGMLAACSMVLLLIAVGWALGGGEGSRPGPIGEDKADTIYVSADWFEASDYQRTEDIISPLEPPAPIPVDGIADSYNPIDDTLVRYEDEQEEYEEEPDHDPFAPQGFFGQGGHPSDGDSDAGGGGTGGPVVVYLPKINEFRRAEIQPELIYSVQPEYPRFAKDAGLEGRVIIKALVGPEGAVLDAVVYVSSGHVLLDEAALAVAGKYKYRPAIQNHRPIAIWVTYTVEFKLD